MTRNPTNTPRGGTWKEEIKSAKMWMAVCTTVVVGCAAGEIYMCDRFWQGVGGGGADTIAYRWFGVLVASWGIVGWKAWAAYRSLSEKRTSPAIAVLGLVATVACGVATVVVGSAMHGATNEKSIRKQAAYVDVNSVNAKALDAAAQRAKLISGSGATTNANIAGLEAQLADLQKQRDEYQAKNLITRGVNVVAPQIDRVRAQITEERSRLESAAANESKANAEVSIKASEDVLVLAAAARKDILDGAEVTASFKNLTDMGESVGLSQRATYMLLPGLLIVLGIVASSMWKAFKNKHTLLMAGMSEHEYLNLTTREPEPMDLRSGRMNGSPVHLGKH